MYAYQNHPPCQFKQPHVFPKKLGLSRTQFLKEPSSMTKKQARHFFKAQKQKTESSVSEQTRVWEPSFNPQSALLALLFVELFFVSKARCDIGLDPRVAQLPYNIEVDRQMMNNMMAHQDAMMAQMLARAAAREAEALAAAQAKQQAEQKAAQLKIQQELDAQELTLKQLQEKLQQQKEEQQKLEEFEKSKKLEEQRKFEEQKQLTEWQKFEEQQNLEEQKKLGEQKWLEGQKRRAEWQKSLAEWQKFEEQKRLEQQKTARLEQLKKKMEKQKDFEAVCSIVAGVGLAGIMALIAKLTEPNQEPKDQTELQENCTEKRLLLFKDSKKLDATPKLDVGTSVLFYYTNFLTVLASQAFEDHVSEIADMLDELVGKTLTVEQIVFIRKELVRQYELLNYVADGEEHLTQAKKFKDGIVKILQAGTVFSAYDVIELTKQLIQYISFVRTIAAVDVQLLSTFEENRREVLKTSRRLLEVANNFQPRKDSPEAIFKVLATNDLEQSIKILTAKNFDTLEEALSLGGIAYAEGVNDNLKRLLELLKNS